MILMATLSASVGLCSQTTFPYPTKPTIKFAPSNVETNLIKLYYSEIEKVKSNLAEGLPLRERDIAISKALQTKNADLLKLLDTNVNADPNLVLGSLSQEQAQRVLLSLVNHPIVGNDALEKKYDVAREVGFCFGRATFVHMELLRRGVDPSSIAKIFAIGRLNHEAEAWDYHVTTIVRGNGGKWLVIDGRGTGFAEGSQVH